MRLIEAIVFALLLLGTISSVCATEPPPGGIRLLPGFVHHKVQGIDSTVGEITGNGLTIAYDIGEMAGVYTDCKTCGWTDGQLWRKKQQINGHPVVIVYTKKQQMVISFPDSKANFYATVRSEADISDVLLMVLTFNSR